MSTHPCIEYTGLSGLCPQCPAWFDCTGSDPLAAPRCPACSSPAQLAVRVPAVVGVPAAAGAGVASAGPELWVG